MKLQFMRLSKRHLEARKNFACGEEALNRYLAQYAGQDVQRRRSICFVVEDAECGRIAGYVAITIRPCSVFPLEFGESNSCMVLLGRLAVDQNYQHLGLASKMVKFVLQYAEDLPVLGVLVEPKNQGLVVFYSQFGFALITENPLLMGVAFPKKKLN